MIQGPANNLGNITGITSTPGKSSSPNGASGSNFADMLNKSIDEVSRLQRMLPRPLAMLPPAKAKMSPAS
jgi:flagellar hook-basal body complex protein FliE